LGSSLSETRGPTSPLSTGRHYRGDGFSCLVPAPLASSRHLYTGHHQGHTQAAPWLKDPPPGRAFVLGTPLTSQFRCHHVNVSMRQQWFTHVRLLVAYLPRCRRDFSATLTTPALDRRSLRWFGISACTATPEGPPPSLAQHASCWRASTSSSLRFQDTRGVQLSRFMPPSE
jgi:hypothetical protein